MYSAVQWQNRASILSEKIDFQPILFPFTAKKKIYDHIKSQLKYNRYISKLCVFVQITDQRKYGIILFVEKKTLWKVLCGRMMAK